MNSLHVTRDVRTTRQLLRLGAASRGLPAVRQAEAHPGSTSPRRFPCSSSTMTGHARESARRCSGDCCPCGVTARQTLACGATSTLWARRSGRSLPSGRRTRNAASSFVSGPSQRASDLNFSSYDPSDAAELRKSKISLTFWRWRLMVTVSRILIASGKTLLTNAVKVPSASS